MSRGVAQEGRLLKLCLKDLLDILGFIIWKRVYSGNVNRPCLSYASKDPELAPLRLLGPGNGTLQSEGQQPLLLAGEEGGVSVSVIHQFEKSLTVCSSTI